MQIFDRPFPANFLLFCLAAQMAFWASCAGAQTQSADDMGSGLEAFQSGLAAYSQGDKKAAIDALEHAAEKGVALAQWKLAHMCALGDGMEADPLRAFQLFYQIANTHAEISPLSPEAPFVASAFVALGGYFEEGIENTSVVKDLYQARQMYTYAAAYFGNSVAQYRLARMYLEGRGGAKNTRQAARWLKLAAEKGHVPAQAELGRILFFGEGLRHKKPVQGLKWVLLAYDHAKERQNSQIATLHAQMWTLATSPVREAALEKAKSWIKDNPSWARETPSSVLASSIETIINNENPYPPAETVGAAAPQEGVRPAARSFAEDILTEPLP